MTLWLRKGAGKVHKLDFTHFTSVLTVEAVGVNNHFKGFPDDKGTLNVDICEGFNFVSVQVYQWRYNSQSDRCTLCHRCRGSSKCWAFEWVLACS
jgi:hypothetical protein